jgi:hypothetical protein
MISFADHHNTPQNRPPEYVASATAAHFIIRIAGLLIIA